MADNNQNWNDFIDESRRCPEALSGVEDRLQKRILKEHRKRSAIFTSLSTLAAMFLFVILVNTSAAFASVISNIPLLNQLAEFVKFDKSLTHAIENDYVQEIDLVAQDGETKLLLPYVIADEKNLVLFFRLPEEFNQASNEWVSLSLNKMVERTTGREVKEFSCSTSSLSPEGREQNHGFILQRYHFEETLPKSIEIEVEMKVEALGNPGAPASKVSLNQFPETDESDLKTIGTFTFQIDFKEFAPPVIYELHKEYVIEGQQMILEEMKVYPTGTEVNFRFADHNTAWIKGLDLAVERDGEIVLKGSQGMSGAHDEVGKWMRVYIESDYFSTSKQQQLLIQGIRLLNKEEEFITVDLNKKTFTPAIFGTALKEVTIHGTKANLVFTTKTAENDAFGMFSFQYRDDKGNDYNLEGEGSTSGSSVMETYITVEYPESGKIVLQRALSPKRILDEPVRIDLPVPK